MRSFCKFLLPIATCVLFLSTGCGGGGGGSSGGGAASPPTSATASVTTPEDTVASFTPTVTDPDVGDTFTFAIAGSPAHGTAAVTANKAQLVYSPSLNYNGSDAFTFVATDSTGLKVTGTATVTVTPVNDAPTAASVAVFALQDTAAAVTPTVSDPDVGDTFTFTIVTQPTHGTAQIVNNQIVYTPTTPYAGADSFTFRATDSGGLSVDGTGTVDVGNVNDPPVASAATLTTSEDTAGSVTPTVTDPDAGDTYTLAIMSQGTHGTASVQGNQLVYTPAAHYFGSDSFGYKATDAGGLSSNTATVTVTVNHVNHAPTAVSGSLRISAGRQGWVIPRVADPDTGDTYTLTAATAPAHGTIAISGNTVTYTPAAGYTGTDPFSLRATDGGGLWAEGSVTVTVQTPPATALKPQDVVFGDFNGDGKTDMAVANQNSDLTEVASIWLGNGDGTFGTRVAVVPTNPDSAFLGAIALAVGKLNADAYDDLVILYLDNDSYAVALGNATPATTPVTAGAAVPLPVNSWPTAGVLADIDGDSKRDLVVALLHADQLLVQYGNGDGTFQTPGTSIALGTGAQPYDVTAGDIDGDGQPEIVAALLTPTSTAPGWVSVVKYSAGTFSIVSGNAYTDPSQTTGARLAVADLNGDGKADVVRTLAAADQLAVQFGTANAQLAAPLILSLPLGSGPRDVAIADITGDGTPDLVVADKLTGDIALFTGPAAAWTGSTAPTTITTHSAPEAIAARDLTGEGKADIITVHPSLNQIGLMIHGS